MDEREYPREYPDDEPYGQRVDTDIIREIWHRRRGIGILAFCAVFACAIGAISSLPNLYRASAKVLVDRQEVSESYVRPSVTSELETRIQTIHQQVMSRERLTALITSLNLYPEERRDMPLEAVVNMMRRDVDLHLEGLEANGRNATVAFTVGFNGRDPVTTAKVANTLASYYVEENSKGRKRQAMRTAAFLNEQVDSLKKELQQHDSVTGDFIRRNAAALPQQLGANESALARLSASLQVNGELQQRQVDRRERLQRELAESTNGAALADQRTAESDLSKMKQDLAALKNRYSDRYPEVVRLSAEVSAREQQLAARSAANKAASANTETPATLAEVDSSLKALKAEEASLRAAIRSYESRVASTPSRALELDRLARGSDTTRERYQALVKVYEDAQAAAALEQGEGAEEFRVLDAAIPARDPVAPNRTWLLLMAVAAALAAGVVAILVFEKIDTSFHAPDELRSFVKAPILATIPRVFTVAATRRRRARRVLVAGAAIVVLTLLAAGSWYVAAGNETITRLTSRGA